MKTLITTSVLSLALLAGAVSAQSADGSIKGSTKSNGAGPLAPPGTYKLFGTGCKGTGGFNYCETQNPTSNANTNTTWVGNAWFAHKVVIKTVRIVLGFEFFLKAGSSTTVPARVWMNDGSGGRPGTVLQNSTMQVEIASGWRRTTWTKPLILRPGTYFIGFRNTAGVNAEVTTGSNGCYWWFGSWNREWCHRKFAWKVICAGGGNAVPTLGNTKVPEINKSFSIDIDMASSSSPVGIIIGSSKTKFGAFNLPLNLTPFGAPGCTLYTSLDIIFGMASNSNGSVKLNIPIPNVAALIGIIFYNQAFVVDPSANALGLAWTNAGEGKIGG